MITLAPQSASGTSSAVALLPVHRTGVIAWVLRLAGLNALINGVGFGAFSIPAAWHLAHEHAVWYAYGNPTYGHGPFEDNMLGTTVPLLMAFFGSCLVLAVGGALLLVPRSSGIVVTVMGMISCAPFWWGFDLPLAWVNAAVITALLTLGSLAWLLMMLDQTLRLQPDSGDRRTSEQPRGPDDARRHG